MENSKKEILGLETLLACLDKLNYPRDLIFLDFFIVFPYKNTLLKVIFPIAIKNANHIYLIFYLKPQNTLNCFERALLALARLYIKPLPHFGIITNLVNFILIDFYTSNISRGGIDLIPRFETFSQREALKPKDFNSEIEKKILTLYLEGG